MNARLVVGLTLLAIAGRVAFVAAQQKPLSKTATQMAAGADLRISEYVFTVPGADQTVRAFVIDQGNASRPRAMSGTNFALVAARFKNSGGNYVVNNDKLVLVHVLNSGTAASGPCRIMLTVQKINGVSVGRKKVATVAALGNGKDLWVLIDAKTILPNNVPLESTSFELHVDATNVVAEANENNNQVSHNQ